ncbi:MAG: glycosyltransferase family 39 protein [Parcubacteria group bacterium]|nr:glycosyltransferase family 39 protein [Parcubacteria group bacterium]
MKNKNPNKTKTSAREILSILGLFLIWRIILQFIAFLSHNRFSLNPDTGYGNIESWEAPITNFFKYFIKWDSGFYLQIAEKGYYLDQVNNLSNTPFFPLYPLLINLLGNVFGNLYAGLLISFISTFFACFYLYKLAKTHLKNNAAFRSVFYFLIFPTAIFLSAIYTESLFMALSIGCFYYARRNKWWAAGIFGFFAALTRPQGILLFPVLLFEYVEQNKFDIKKLKFNALWTLLIPSGLFVYMYFLKLKFGSLFLFISAQNSWGRSTSFSAKSVYDTFSNYFYALFFPGSESFTYYLVKDLDLFFFLTFLVLSIIIFVKFRMSYGFYMILSLIIPLMTSSLMSINRFALLLFPTYIFLAKISKNQVVQYSIILLFSFLFVMYTILFTNWYWAG